MENRNNKMTVNLGGHFFLDKLQHYLSFCILIIVNHQKLFYEIQTIINKTRKKTATFEIGLCLLSSWL